MARKERGEPHHYDVHALDKDNDRIKGRVGRAWVNPAGYISVVFEPFVVIQGGRHAVTLFPADRFEKEKTDVKVVVRLPVRDDCDPNTGSG